MDTRVPPQAKKAQLLDTRATRRRITQMATCDRAATPYNVNNHVCIMQKVGKQQTEGHKLAQHQLSNYLCAALEKQTNSESGTV